MSPIVAVSSGLQRIRLRLDAFVRGHALLLLIVLLCIIAARPLAIRLFRFVIQNLS